MPSAIRAAVFGVDDAAHCVIEELYLADPGPEEMVVEVRACGICHTDIGCAEVMPRPSVLGHELAGEIVEIGNAVSGYSVGDRVVATFSSCGRCANCSDGAPAYCMTHIGRNFDGVRPDGSASILDGDGSALYAAFFQQSGFASHALVRQDNAVLIPDELSFEMAAPLGCGIQTGAGAVMNSLGAKAGESIAVFGAGSVGLAAVMAARHVGCTPIIAIDQDDERLALALELGAHHAFRGSTDQLVEVIRRLTDGGAHYSLESTGAEGPFHHAIGCLRPRGTCGTLAYPGRFGDPVVHPGGFAFMDTRLMGIIEGDSVPKTFIPALAVLFLAGQLPYDRLVRTFPFDDINVALDAMRKRDVIKPVLVF